MGAVRDVGERKRDRAGIAALGRFLDDRAAGKSKPQELRHLVERLAGGVVARLPDEAVLAWSLRVVERRVTTRDDQRQERVLGRILGEERGVDMALEMVHADQRLLVHPGERLGHRAADQERAHESRPLGHGDAVEIGQRHTGVAEGLGDDGRDDLEVPA